MVVGETLVLLFSFCLMSLFPRVCLVWAEQQRMFRNYWSGLYQQDALSVAEALMVDNVVCY